MKQPIFFILFLAMLFSAASCFSTKGYHLNNQNEWAKSPDVDSIAFQVLLQGTNVWDYPEFFEPAGFQKYTFTPALIQTDTNTMVRLDLEGKSAEVTIVYSGWDGNWVYEQDEEGYWQLISKKYSSRFVPEISNCLHLIFNDLFTASSQAELAWLTEFLGEDSIEVQDSSLIYQSADQRKIWADQIIDQLIFFEDWIKLATPDTTYIDNEGVSVAIFFDHELRFEINWDEGNSLRLLMISDTASDLNAMLYETLRGEWHAQVWKQNKSDLPGQWRSLDETWNFKVSEDRSMVSTDNDYPSPPEMTPLPETGQQLESFLEKLQNLQIELFNPDFAYEYFTADTTMMDADSVVWNITFTTDPDFDWTWEYETSATPTSSLVYYFDSAEKCIRARNMHYSMEFVEAKDVTPLSTRTIQIVRFSGSFFEIDCLNAPPIAPELTGLKQ